jgi:hypothetical protein
MGKEKSDTPHERAGTVYILTALIYRRARHIITGHIKRCTTGRNASDGFRVDSE